MTWFCQAPPHLVVETQPSAPKARFQHTILLAKKRDRVLVFTLSPPAQRLQENWNRNMVEIYFRRGRSLV